ncbi:MAG: YraN family protein [Prevotella sp.]|nr:YraN family protein [Prevotella sp.]MBQ8702684.1 YraN family protein [Prevotella sp.]
MAQHNELGQWGEDLAAEHLCTKGYVIVERDWHSGRRDLDIIAIDSDTLVFVEVKTRRNNMFADPAAAVDYRKIQNLRQAANHFIKSRGINNPVRFDIVTVTGTPGGTPDIDHIVDAF